MGRWSLRHRDREGRGIPNAEKEGEGESARDAPRRTTRPSNTGGKDQPHASPHTHNTEEKGSGGWVGGHKDIERKERGAGVLGRTQGARPPPPSTAHSTTCRITQKATHTQPAKTATQSKDLPAWTVGRATMRRSLCLWWVGERERGGVSECRQREKGKAGRSKHSRSIQQHQSHTSYQTDTGKGTRLEGVSGWICGHRTKRKKRVRCRGGLEAQRRTAIKNTAVAPSKHPHTHTDGQKRRRRLE